MILKKTHSVCVVIFKPKRIMIYICISARHHRTYIYIVVHFMYSNLKSAILSGSKSTTIGHTVVQMQYVIEIKVYHKSCRLTKIARWHCWPFKSNSRSSKVFPLHLKSVWWHSLLSCSCNPQIT